jgi:hypothetical protein
MKLTKKQLHIVSGKFDYREQLLPTSGFVQLGQDQQFFSFSTLTIIGYEFDR